LQGPHMQMVVTMLLLVVLGATFLRGFREVIGLAVVIVGIYLALNLIVVGSGLYYLWEHPETLQSWLDKIQQGAWHFDNPLDLGTSWWGIVGVCILLFPKLALG